MKALISSLIEKIKELEYRIKVLEPCTGIKTPYEAHTWKEEEEDFIGGVWVHRTYKVCTFCGIQKQYRA